MIEDILDYLKRRRAEEEARSTTALTERARLTHQELASRYAEAISAEERMRGLQPIDQTESASAEV